MNKIAILGGGMAGFGAAHHFHKNGQKATIYEKQSYHGGHATSFYSKGFTFDNGPHISFTKVERIKNLFAQSVDNKYESFVAGVNNYWNGHWVKHPAQVNLYGLPEEMVVQIIEEFIEAKYGSKKEIKTYKAEDDPRLQSAMRKFIQLKKTEKNQHIKNIKDMHEVINIENNYHKNLT